MRFNYYKTIYMFFLLLFLGSCSSKCVVENIEVSELLSTKAKEKYVDYFELLKIALTGDDNAIRELSILEFNDAVGYDQGAVLVDLIIVLGEKEYVKSISNIDRIQKKLIHSYIDVGLSYGNNPLVKGGSFKNTFPELYTMLNE